MASEYVSPSTLARTRRLAWETFLAAPTPSADDVRAHAERVSRCSCRAGGDDRGKSRDRRTQKYYLLRAYGNGQVCACMWCGLRLTIATVTEDRLIPGSSGGKYVRSNLGPACVVCNRSRGDVAFTVAARRWHVVRMHGRAGDRTRVRGLDLVAA